MTLYMYLIGRSEMWISRNRNIFAIKEIDLNKMLSPQLKLRPLHRLEHNYTQE